MLHVLTVTGTILSPEQCAVELLEHVVGRCRGHLAPCLSLLTEVGESRVIGADSAVFKTPKLREVNNLT